MLDKSYYGVVIQNVIYRFLSIVYEDDNNNSTQAEIIYILPFIIQRKQNVDTFLRHFEKKSILHLSLVYYDIYSQCRILYCVYQKILTKINHGISVC